MNDTAGSQDQSGFLHGEYKFTDKFGLSAGLRYSHVKKTYTFNRPGLLQLPEREAKEDHVDWLVSGNYHFTDDVMGYASVSTGSRPPGLNVHPASPNQVTPFPGERLTSYETGVKTEFFDHRLRFNLTGFYSDYKVRNTTDPGFECPGGPNSGPPPNWVPTTGDCGANGFVYWYISVGKPASIKGGEFELTAEPIPRLLVNLDGGYNHFKSGVSTPGEPGYIFPGNFPQPEWNGSGGVQYAAQTAIGTFTPRLDWFYTSVQTYGPSETTQAPSWVVPAHSVFNAQVAYAPNDSKWTVTAASTNITNKYYCYDVFGGSGFELSCNAARPREWLVSLRRDF